MRKGGSPAQDEVEGWVRMEDLLEMLKQRCKVVRENIGIEDGCRRSRWGSQMVER